MKFFPVTLLIFTAAALPTSVRAEEPETTEPLAAVPA